MNKQEVFNKVRDHMLKQNARSTNVYNRCQYRGDNGLMCAAGCLILDEMYRPDMDAGELELSWGSVCNRYPKLRDSISTDSNVHSLISNLQGVHDNILVHNWPEALKNMAIGHGLQP
jgi:hypothetical protein